MTGLDTIREKMRDYLEAQGISALCAFPMAGRTTEEPVVVVSLRQCDSSSAGFSNYLGQIWEGDSQSWQELYGQRVRLTIGLDLYAAMGSGEEGVRTAFDQLTAVLHKGGPEGLRLQNVSCGETTFDRQERRYRCPAQAVYDAMLYAVRREDGSFQDFEVKGDMKCEPCDQS